ncbi:MULTISPECIES: O-antigen ligase [unclassified Pseudoclavibacter]|uniref:O-antigen ligase family protein n=1 Tax=unclassified Pseudoclavibacter TaxID=2615177 RepID=UPI0015E46C82|nr:MULTISPECIES: O-antigen ligase family protein [unclassified Pseudoclavibacter]
MTEVLLPILIVVATLIGLRVAGATTTVALVALVGLALFPRSQVYLFGFDPVPLSTVSLFICVIIAIFAKPRLPIPVVFIPLVAYLILMVTTGWTNPHVSGDALTLILVAILAWFVGTFVGRAETAPQLERWLAFAILAILGFQALIALGQSFGLSWFAAVSEASILESGRSAGTAGHPGNLGKIVICLTAIALPLSTSTDKVVARAATFAMLAGLLGVGLSASRTNFIALIGMLGLWIILQRGKGVMKRRIWFGGAIALVGALSLDAILARFQQDPLGGEREHLLAVAQEHIGRNLMLGIGPGNYITYFGQFDALTARGWPVHNVFYYVTAEQGVVGALLFFGPMVALVIKGLRDYNRKNQHSDSGLALFTLTMAMIVVGLTGWGFAGGFLLHIWFFTFGYFSGKLAKKPVELPPPVAALPIRPAAKGLRLR